MLNERGIFILAVLMLCGVGVLMVYSASVTSRPTDQQEIYLTRHLAALAIGGVVAVVASSLSARVWSALAMPLFVVSTLLLIGVLIPGLGSRAGGAARWYRYGPVSFQPSELAKVALVLFLARLLARREEREEDAQEDDTPRPLEGLRALFKLTVPVAVTCGLIVIEPDFGTAVLLAAVGGIALFLGGVRMRNLALAGIVAAAVAALLVWQHPYRLKRITGLMTVWSDWSEAPYQMRQSLVALGSGGLFGTGLGKGWQKLSFLPEANTDFVFAVIGEELGLVGTVTVVLLWMALLVAGARMLRRVDSDRFASLAAFTLLVGLVMQAMINMAVVTALLPPKGLPLPLVSYGGSSLTTSLLSVGIILGLARFETQRPGSVPAPHGFLSRTKHRQRQLGEQAAEA